MQINHRARLPLTTVGSLSMALMCLSGCSAGPDYVRPQVNLPAQYQLAEGWKLAQPGEATVGGTWWEVYGDPALNALVPEVKINNQNVAQAEANYREASATLDQARAGVWPSVSATVSGNHSGGSAASSTSSHTLGINGSWAPDLWGKLSRQVDADRANAAASQAELAAALLSAQGVLVSSYFQLRFNEAQHELLAQTIANNERSLAITRHQYEAGMVAKADVVQAEAQLLSVRAQQADLAVQHEQLLHAMAVLLGKAPGEIHLPAGKAPDTLPGLPKAGLPSDLLERRPDIAAAERRVAAANAAIGVAHAALYPSLSLTASAGLQGRGLTPWMDAPTHVWSLGFNAAQLLIDGGAYRAAERAARANYDTTVAGYRQTVLSGLQSVADNLSTLDALANEARLQAEALTAARESARLVHNQYQAGTVSYLNVAVADSNALTAEINALAIRNRQFQAHVALIQNLGGGAE